MSKSCKLYNSNFAYFSSLAIHYNTKKHKRNMKEIFDDSYNNLFMNNIEKMKKKPNLIKSAKYNCDNCNYHTKFFI